MTHVYQSANSLLEAANQLLYKYININESTLNENLNFWDKVLQGNFLKETVFFSLDLIYGDSDNGFLKHGRVISLTWNL